MGYKYYDYNPSEGAAIPFAALFALSTVVQIGQTIRARTWYLLPFIIGGSFEAIGYLCRFINATETPDWTMKPYIGQSLLILLGPALFAASVYMLLGRIIRALNAGSLSLIRPSWLTKIFVTGDIISFLLQSGGGGLMASATDAENAKMGEHMILSGLFVQILFFGVFIVVSIVFHRRMLSTPAHRMGTDIPWNKYIKVLYIVSILIMVRSVYRVAEYIEGKGGELMSKEIYIYALDGALMLACCFVFNIWHPKGVVDGRRPGYKQAEDLEMFTGHPERNF